MMQTKYNYRAILAEIFITPLFIIIIVEAAIIPFMGTQLMAQKQQAIQQVVEVAYGIVNDNEKQMLENRISLAEAQERAKRILKDIRYSGKDYFWINDMGKPVPKMIMHPTEPFLDGKLLDNPEFNRANSLRYGLNGPEKKLDNLNLFVAFTEVAEKAGHGYVTYYWAKPALGGGITQELYQKLSYVKLFKPWGWVIGSGVYVDDVYEETAKLRFWVYGSTLIFTIVLLIISYLINSAKRRQVEQALRETRELFSLLMHFSPVYIFIKEVTPTGSHVLQVSDNFQQMVGIPSSEMIGKSMEELFPAEFAAKINADDREVIAKGEALRIEEEFNGFSYTTIKFPLVQAGKKNLLAGFTIDVTERKQAEDALRYEQIFSNKLLDSLPGIFYLYTYPELRLIRWNIQHETLLSYESGEIEGRYIMDFHVAEAKEAVLSAVETVMEKGQNSIEAQLLAKDGRLIPFFLTGVKLESQGKLYLMGIGIDITERKRAEQDKLSLQQQLHQAQKIESFAVLAGGIAHNFNNLLTVIVGRCALANVKPETALNHIPAIEAAAENAAELCRRMMTYAGKGQSVPALINMRELVQDTINILKPAIKQNVTIRLSLADIIPLIKGEESQIRQMVTNVVDNACEAIGDEQGVIVISLAETEMTPEHAELDYLGVIIPDGKYVCLEVTDNGCGMDDEARRRIFEPFYTTKFFGRGLGMSAVHGIITAHGGAIQLTSQPGTGTTFKVFLPVRT